MTRNRGQWGGARPGAGHPKGTKNKATKERLLVEEEFRRRAIATADELMNSQMALTLGVSCLYRVETKTTKNGIVKSKPVQIKNQKDIEAYLAGEYDDSDTAYYYITTDKPDNKAIDSLWDRVLGKPTMRTELTGAEGEPLIDNAKIAEANKALSVFLHDNNGNYEPSNCRWATRSEQRKNQRRQNKIRMK